MTQQFLIDLITSYLVETPDVWLHKGDTGSCGDALNEAIPWDD